MDFTKTIDPTHLEFLISGKADVLRYFYLYEIKRDRSSCIGLITSFATSLVIKKNIFLHEKVQPKKIDSLKESLLNHPVQKKPILLLHNHRKLQLHLLGCNLRCAQRIIQKKYEKECEVHSIYCVSSDSLNLSSTQVSHFLLADGHHRFSAIGNQSFNRDQKGHKQPRALAVLFFQEDVTLLSHLVRLKLPLNHLNASLLKMRQLFYFSPFSYNRALEDSQGLENSHALLMHKRQVHKISFKKNTLKQKSKVEVINQYLIYESLGINYLNKTEDSIRLEYKDKIDFEQCNESNVIQIYVPSDKIEQVFYRAQNGFVYDPHSTYFFPRLKEGLLFFNLNNRKCGCYF